MRGAYDEERAARGRIRGACREVLQGGAYRGGFLATSLPRRVGPRRVCRDGPELATPRAGGTKKSSARRDGKGDDDGLNDDEADVYCAIIALVGVCVLMCFVCVSVLARACPCKSICCVGVRVGLAAH